MVVAHAQSSHRFIRRAQQGFALLLAMVATVLILAMGLAILEVSRIDQVRSHRELQTLQARAAAEYGVGLARAMAQSQKVPWIGMTYNGLPLAFGYSTDPQYGGHQVCALFANRAIGGAGNDATYSVVIEDLTGSVASSGTYRIHGFGVAGPVKSHVVTDAQSLTFGSFLWFTENENGVYFSDGDYMDGLVYSSDQLNIWGSPVFKDRVISAGGTIHYGQGGAPSDNPDFEGGLTLNADPIDINSVANLAQIDAIRKAAASGGYSLPPNNGYPYSITFNPSGTFTIAKSDKKGKWTEIAKNKPVSSTNGAFYIDETVQVKGQLDGQVTLLTSTGHDIQIVDDLYYAYPSGKGKEFTPDFNPSDPLFNDKLALISGGNVVFSKDWNNGWGDMYVTASIMSINGGVTNEYYDRGPNAKTLHLYGGIVQKTRGPVGTVGGTGFTKDYHYDKRFLLNPPPYTPKVGYEFQQWSLDP